MQVKSTASHAEFKINNQLLEQILLQVEFMGFPISQCVSCLENEVDFVAKQTFVTTKIFSLHLKKILYFSFILCIWRYHTGRVLIDCRGKHF